MRALPTTLSLALGACLACAHEPEGPPPSLLVVGLDTVRADRLGCYGRADAGTPHLDALAARGVRFTRCYTTVPLTLPAHTSLFTGLAPSQHGVRDNVFFRAEPSLLTLAELLVAAGYRTGAFLGALPLHASFGLDQGFEVYDDDVPPGTPISERRADQVTTRALEWIDGLARAERFFAFVHLFDAHAPYDPPPAFARAYPDDLYQGELAYLDAALGRLFARLDERGRLADTLVVVVADHGEGLGEHGEDTHGFLLHDATMRVPWIVAGPGVAAAPPVEASVGLVDVLPTVLELLGLDAPDGLAGRSLAAALRAPSAVADAPVALETRFPAYGRGWSPLAGLVEGPWKLVEADGHAPELFDLAADPGEREDRAAADPARVARLAARLAALQARWPDRETRVAALDDALTLDEFAKLGYVDTARPDGAQRGAHPRDRMALVQATGVARRTSDSGAHVAALAQLDTLEATFGPDPGLSQVRGLVHWRLADVEPDAGHRERARAAYAAALERNPTHLVNWCNLSALELELGDPVAALRAAERALAIGPGDPLAVEAAGRARAAVEDAAHADALRGDAR